MVEVEAEVAVEAAAADDAEGALLTGGVSGIGAATSGVFAVEGANVAFNSLGDHIVNAKEIT